MTSIASRIGIGRAAELTGLTVRAIRLYEQRGLVRSQRDARDSRVFTSADVDRLVAIAELRALEVGLDEISALVDLGAMPGGAAPDRLVQALESHRRTLLGRLVRLDRFAQAVAGESREAPISQGTGRWR